MISSLSYRRRQQQQQQNIQNRRDNNNHQMIQFRITLMMWKWFWLLPLLVSSLSYYYDCNGWWLCFKINASVSSFSYSYPSSTFMVQKLLRIKQQTYRNDMIL